MGGWGSAYRRTTLLAAVNDSPGSAPEGPTAPTPKSEAVAPPADPTRPGDAEARTGAESQPSQERRRVRRRRRGRGAAGGSAEGAEAEGSPAASEGSAAEDAASGEQPPRTKGRRRRRGARKGGESADDAKPDAPSKSAAREAAPKRDASKRPARRGARPDAGARRPDTLSASAVRALSEMARGLLDAEGVDPFSRPRWLDLKLRVPLDFERDARKAAQDVVSQILGRVAEVRAHEQALRPGSAFCYFSESADAPTARPQKPREIFDGYSSTGRPVFTDFVTLAIERRDAGIDDLVDGQDVIVTHVSMGRVLRTQQLHEFGAESGVYRILGQVDAGLYPLLGSDQKAAFSFQLLRGTTLDGSPRFRLHWVGAAEVRDIADPAVGSILKRFQLRLERESLRFAGLHNQGGGGVPDEEEFVLPLLQELAKRLSGRARRAVRRTEHATQRVDERVRPTAKAWDDAREAGDDRILRDDEQGTIVVVGPKNRLHVFSPEAMHVTSFVLTGGQVQKRRGEGRWHPAEPEERGEFRLALRRRLQQGEVAEPESL
jgi:hypothetical protein